ncbi:hypothetical protein ACFCZT_26195 [Streptomyces sp. NPDC056230]|uniref:hypothetical protein n=1 Tax=Streptomyces sp. NPDC056230 TaxID=3345754 RepID=UPI0035E16703
MSDRRRTYAQRFSRPPPGGRGQTADASADVSVGVHADAFTSADCHAVRSWSA